MQCVIKHDLETREKESNSYYRSKDKPPKFKLFNFYVVISNLWIGEISKIFFLLKINPQ